MHAQVGLMAGAQRLGRHVRSEIGAADAEIDDVGDAFAGIAAPLAAMDAFAKIGHARQDGLDLGRCGFAGAQRSVADGAVFRVVDLFARLHAPHPALQVGFVGQFAQQVHGFCADALLAVIDEQGAVLERQAAEAQRIGGEKIAQMGRAQLAGVRFQGLPGRRLGELAVHQTATGAAMCGCGS